MMVNIVEYIFTISYVLNLKICLVIHWNHSSIYWTLSHRTTPEQRN